jgi:hypothetical protein
METALYYTLSTIAQTLAGSLGILVAVVLFKLAALGRVIDDGKDEMDRRNVNTTQAWPILLSQGFEAMAVHLETVQHMTNIRHHGPLRQATEKARAAYRAWGSINGWLYLTIVATVVDLALCFAALPFTPKVSASGHGWLVLCPAVGLGVLCVGLYAGLVVTMVRRPELS